MKTRLVVFNVISFVTTFVLILSFCHSFAQSDSLNPKWAYSIIGGATQSTISNESIDEDIHLKTRSMEGLRFENQFACRIDENVYFILGLNYERFLTISESKGWYQGSLSIDRDNYYYYPVYITDYKMTRKLTILELPIGVQVFSGKPDKTHFLFELGLMPAMPLFLRKIYEGDYSYEGFYPTQQSQSVYLLVKNDSYYGYSDNQLVTKDEKVPTRGFVLCIFANAGFASPISRKVCALFKVSYLAPWQDVVDEKEKNSAYKDITGKEYRYSKTTFSSLGVNVGFRVALK